MLGFIKLIAPLAYKSQLFWSTCLHEAGHFGILKFMKPIAPEYLVCKADCSRKIGFMGLGVLKQLAYKSYCSRALDFLRLVTLEYLSS